MRILNCFYAFFLFAPKGNPIDENLEIQRSREMWEACEKLYKQYMNKRRNHSYWRRAPFLKAYPEIIKIHPRFELTVVCAEYLLTFSKIWNYFTKNCRTFSTENSKTYLQSSAIFDTSITKVVHSFPNNVNAKNSNNTSLDEVQISRAAEDLQTQKHSHRTYSPFSIEELISHKSAICFKS